MKFFNIKKGFGNAGLKYDYRLLGVSLLKITRHTDHDRIKLLSLLSLRVGKNNKKKQCFNNEEALHDISESTSKKIVFVVRDLQATGGVESRLHKLAVYLKKKDILPIFITQNNANVELRKEINLYCNLSLPESSTIFSTLMERINPDVIEFQFKSPKIFHDLSDAFFKSIPLKGVCIHEEVNFDINQIKKVDYIISSTRRKCVSGINDCHIVPNWLSFPATPLWSYNGQGKAVIISRISKDKLPTIINFIELCNSMNIEYDIAGSIEDEESVRVFNQLLRNGIPQSAFIGGVKTVQFLKKNTNKYLFVAGVGQVAIEASSIGYPFAVSPHFGGYENTVFLEKENVNALLEKNFTIKDDLLLSYRNKDTFSYKNDIVYSVFKKMREYCGEHVLDSYLNIIQRHQ